MTKVLRIALKKLQPHNDRWCAALTAAETLALLDDGYELDFTHSRDRKAQEAFLMEGLRQQIKTGEGRTSWQYFSKCGNHLPLNS